MNGSVQVVVFIKLIGVAVENKVTVLDPVPSAYQN